MFEQLEKTETIRVKRSQKKIPEEVASLRKDSAPRSAVTDTTRSTILIKTNA
jgi:hypothetical protein